MSKVKNLNVSESFDTFESEKVLNEWVINSKDAAAGVQKVIVTDRRLISIEKNEGKKYKKSSYNLDDIKTIDTFAGEIKYFHWQAGILSFMAAVVLLLCGLVFAGNNGINIVLFVFAGLATLLGILLVSIPCYKNEVKIWLELKQSNLGVLKLGCARVNTCAKNTIQLSFIVTQTSIDMAKQIDNCVLRAQNKISVKEKKEMPEPKISE